MTVRLLAMFCLISRCSVCVRQSVWDWISSVSGVWECCWSWCNLLSHVTVNLSFVPLRYPYCYANSIALLLYYTYMYVPYIKWSVWNCVDPFHSLFTMSLSFHCRSSHFQKKKKFRLSASRLAAHCTAEWIILELLSGDSSSSSRC